MHARRRRIPGVTWLAVAVLVLLPALAWLQYTWLDQIAEADRERRARTLQTAATQLAQDLDRELSRAVLELNLEPEVVEQRNWPAYDPAYHDWASEAITPELVKSVYFLEVPVDGRRPVDGPLRVWTPAARTFEETPWPDELAAVRMRFTHEATATLNVQLTPPRRGERGGDRGRNTMRLLLPPTRTGDEQSVAIPVLRITPGDHGGAVPPPPQVKLLGFTILRLDLTAIGRDVLPVLVRRHLRGPDEERRDYFVGVVSQNDRARVLYESETGAAAAAVSNPDVEIPLLGPRVSPMMFMARETRRGGDRPPPPPPSAPPGPEPEGRVVVDVVESRAGDRVMGTGRGGDGPWRLVVKHRAGSLEAAVAAARTRNFVLSSGILALLTAAIGLIVVSARRADRLARQQLEFVAAVSHELRTPVSVIGAAAGNLADGVVGEPDRVKRYGATIQAESRRLAETVERVLQLAGIAAGRAAASRTAVAVDDLVHEALAASRHEIESAGATLEVAIDPALTAAPTDPSGARRVLGDATALRSAIRNLVSNAIKYGGAARWVRVSARPSSARSVRIVIEDRGLGIPADDRKHIFEPFYRGRDAVAAQIQGTGLGLHLVRRIVESHGGTVSVQSEPGRGSTFTIDLPAIREVLITRATAGEHALAFRPPAPRRG